MDLTQLTGLQFGNFFLVFSRASGIFIMTPILSSRQIPVRIKVALAFFIALILIPVVPPLKQEAIFNNAYLFAGAISRELMIGVIIGFIATIFFMSVILAGQIIDLQIGFGLANVIDPATQSQVPVIGQFQYLVAVLVFLVLNGHHWLIKALADSFNLVPLGQFTIMPHMTEGLFGITGTAFTLAWRIGAPVIATLFLLDLALGVLSRAIPQMNVFIVGFPIKIIVGLVTLVITLPFVGIFLTKLFSEMMGTINMFLRGAS